ncbi:hypothetical protein OAG71_03540 [bacterium]|nr:hypothetical protein [bacterium]
MSDVFFTKIRSKLRTILAQRRGSEIKTRFDESDVVQESVLQIWKQIDSGSLRESKVNTGLLRTIAIGHYCKLIRFHLSAKRNVNAEKSFAEGTHPRSSDPVIDAGQIEQLMKGVETLDPIDQHIVLGRFIDDRTVVALSKELGLSAYLINKRLRESIATLERFVDSSTS